MTAKKSIPTPKPRTDIVDSERALVGGLIFAFDRCWPEVSDIALTPDDFNDEPCRRVWGSVERLRDAGQPITEAAVLTDSGVTVDALQSLIDAGAVPAHCRHHATAIRNAALQRRAVESIRAQGNSPEGIRLACQRITEGLPSDDGGGGAVDAVGWLEVEPPPPAYILPDVIEQLARVLLVGSSKTKKSFAALQISVCCAAGLPFIGISPERAFRVLLVNLENQADWQHRRFRCLCRALGVTREQLGDRLIILNGRGLGVTLPQIEAAARMHKAELVVLDPLYKLDGGADECDMSARKALVLELEGMGHRLKAALVIVHHDPKGAAGEKNIRDRGAGSSVINRDVDCTLALSQFAESHPEADNMAVLSVLARNAPPRGDMTLVFREGAFQHLPDVAPLKATSRTQSAAPALNVEAALALVSDKPMTRMRYRDAIRSYGGTRDGRDAWILKAVAEGQLIEQRHGQREKLIGTPRAFELMKPFHNSDTYEGRET
jgi:hypothetical protein